MFPSVAKTQDSPPVVSRDVDWLVNKSYHVPVPTVTIEDSGEESDQVQEVINVSSSSPSSPSSISSIEIEQDNQVTQSASKLDSKEDGFRDYETKHKSSCTQSTSRRSSSKKKRVKHRNRSPIKKKKKHKHKHKHHERDRSKPLHADDNYSNNSVDSKKVFLEETGLSPEKAFRIDRNSDRNNLAFNSIYYLLVPKYDKKKCLKTPRLKHILSKKAKKPDRYFLHRITHHDRENISLTGDKKDSSADNLTIFNSCQPTTLTYGDEFGERLKAVFDSSNMYTVESKERQPKENSQTSSYSKDLTSNKTISSQDRTLRKTEYFNKHLRENPNDIKAWLDFVRFQDECFEWEPQKSQVSREKMLNEKKLSIIDKAIDMNIKCIELKLERLSIMRSLSTPEELDKEWKKLTFVYPNNPQIWRDYFIFLQTHVSYFTVSMMNKAFLKCLDIFNHMVEGTFQTHKPPPSLELETLKIIYHYTNFLSQSGYREKSIAIWQALIEFNLFAPVTLSLDLPLSDWTNLFEPFWDSGCPRFGEKNSSGWSNVMESQSLDEKETAKSIDDLEDEIFVSSQDVSSIWYKLEFLRAMHYWYPIKGTTIEQADDTERAVSFEDVKPVLFRFRSQQTKFKLINTFLKFLGAVEHIENHNDFFYILDGRELLEKMPSYIDLPPPLDYFNFSFFILQVFDQFIEISKRYDSENTKSILLQKLNFLLNRCGHDFQYKYVKKILKDHLKMTENRNDLDVWSLLAELEYKKGNQEEAAMIYHTAISMSIGKTDLNHLLKFVMHYSDLMLNLGSSFKPNITFKGHNKHSEELDNFILKAILESIFGKKCESIGPTQILKATRILESMAQTHDGLKEILHKALVLIHFLSKDHQKALTLCQDLLETNSDSMEKHWNLYIQIQILYLVRSGQSLSTLRSLLHRALESFPSNKFLLAVFIEVESKVAIPIALHRFFTQKIKQTDSVDLNLWTYFINSEMRRLQIMQENSEGNQCCDGIIHKIVSLFERCLSFPRNQDHVFIWRMYSKFAYDQGMIRKCESIMYRGLQHCPWAKILYMDAVKYLPHMVKDIVTLISEKEIRLRTLLEEIELIKQQAKP